MQPNSSQEVRPSKYVTRVPHPALWRFGRRLRRGAAARTSKSVALHDGGGGEIGVEGGVAKTKQLHIFLWLLFREFRF